MKIDPNKLSDLAGNFEDEFQIRFKDIMTQLADEIPGDGELEGEPLYKCFKRAHRELFSKELTLSAGASSLSTNSP